jgi:hypothetical protein
MPVTQSGVQPERERPPRDAPRTGHRPGSTAKRADGWPGPGRWLSVNQPIDAVRRTRPTNQVVLAACRRAGKELPATAPDENHRAVRSGDQRRRRRCRTLAVRIGSLPGRRPQARRCSDSTPSACGAPGIRRDQAHFTIEHSSCCRSASSRARLAGDRGRWPVSAPARKSRVTAVRPRMWRSVATTASVPTAIGAIFGSGRVTRRSLHYCRWAVAGRGWERRGRRRR